MAQPNVLLICTDHWPGLLLHCAGHDHILTPTLDQLAANGIRFTEAYSTTPTCIPARRALLTGTSARTHGDRTFREREPMPKDLPTMPQVFHDAGYQTYAVGKLHVYPQRDRIGFDDALIHEEGRHHLGGGKDDFELFLEREGFAGQELTHAMGNNVYTTRAWHLPEYCHPTNWTVREMCRTIQRRDPTRPGFWYCSLAAPHPPVTPPAGYVAMYQEREVPAPLIGDWARQFESWPYALQARYHAWHSMSPQEISLARSGFYAQCTYIDHQIRLLIGTLNEEGLLDNTIVMFTSDHGDMLGQHGLWAKPLMYEGSAKVPLLLVPTASDSRLQDHQTDDRLACLRDVMPTLLDLCAIPRPATVEGQSLVSDARREHLYCEHYENDLSVRMVRSGRYKLIWYPVGNRFQLFDLAEDPNEMKNLADQTDYVAVRGDLTRILTQNLYGTDQRWITDGQLVGESEKDFTPVPLRNLFGQRGWR